MEICNYCSVKKYLISYTIEICFFCLKKHKEYHNETYNFWKDKQDAEYLNAIGECYYYGIFVNEDYSEAVKWYTLSAEQGNDSAQYNLGYLYKNGLGVKQNYTEAIKWYTLSAKQGNSNAQNNLGYMYDEGLGVKQNYQEALKLYTLSAQQGNDSAQYNLGYMYDEGLGVEQNYQEALKWYTLSAQQGNSSAQNNLDMLLYNLSKEKKLWHARTYKNKKYHDEKDLYHMAICYFKGIFVKKNKKKAYELFKTLENLEDKNRILFENIKDTLNNFLIKDLIDIILEFYLN